MTDSVFNEQVGRFLNPKESVPMKDAYRSAKLACGLKEDEYTRSEFFGAAKINQLLKQKGCVGIRVHYAKRWEDEAGNPTEAGKGQLKPRILLTGVDERGRDLPIPHSQSGLKDDGGDDGEMVVGDGRPCPQFCGQ